MLSTNCLIKYTSAKAHAQSKSNKKRRDSKPGSVLFRHLSSQPTPRHLAGSPHLPVYLVLQVAVAYPRSIATTRRELLPRVFTISERIGCYFLLRLPQGFPCLRFPQYDALSCPDFPQPTIRIDQQTLPAHSRAGMRLTASESCDRDETSRLYFKVKQSLLHFGTQR